MPRAKNATVTITKTRSYMTSHECIGDASDGKCENNRKCPLQLTGSLAGCGQGGRRRCKLQWPGLGEEVAPRHGASAGFASGPDGLAIRKQQSHARLQNADSETRAEWRGSLAGGRRQDARHCGLAITCALGEALEE